MSPDMRFVPLSGSSRGSLAGSRELGPANPKQMVNVTVLLRRRTSAGSPVRKDVFTEPTHNRKFLSRGEYEQSHGAAPEDVAHLLRFCSETNLTVQEVSLARRTVLLTATVAAVSTAFPVLLREYA